MSMSSIRSLCVNKIFIEEIYLSPFLEIGKININKLRNQEIRVQFKAPRSIDVGQYWPWFYLLSLRSNLVQNQRFSVWSKSFSTFFHCRCGF